MKNIVIILFLLVSVSGFSTPIISEEGYVKQNGKWYFQLVSDDGCYSTSLIKIIGIDNSSFEVIKYDDNEYNYSFYAKDKNYVYYRGKRIKDAAPQSVKAFVVCKLYIKDKNYVYYDGKRIIGGADPNTFKVLKYGNYAVDRFGIYYQGTPLMYSLPKNYRFLGDAKSFYTIYVISNNRVFFKESEIKGADAATFEIVQNIGDRQFTIAKDKNHVYIDNQTFTGLDTKTFEFDTVAYVNRRKVHCGRCSYYAGDCYDWDLQVSVKDKNGIYWVKLDEGNIYDTGTPRTFRLDVNKGVVKIPILDDSDVYVDDDDNPIIEGIIPPTRFPDVKAEYPSGTAALMKFITDNINYPQDAKDANIQGVVMVEFEIKTDGSIGNVTIFKKVHPSLDKEAIRLVKSMGEWKPARDESGKAIPSLYQIPVQFKLEQKK